jgi:acyl-CoA hydrolase
MTEHFKTSSFNVFPTDLNHGNTLFGGKILAEIDCEAAKVARSVIYNTQPFVDAHEGVKRYPSAVTARFEVDFQQPAYQADLVIMEADVVELGRTSMKINVDAYVWNGPDRTNWRKICQAKTVFVCVLDGKPYPHGQTLENK